MATPMQYELVNRLLSSPPPSSSEWNKNTPHERALAQSMIDLYHRSTLVDASNIWTAICVDQSNPAHVMLDEGAVSGFLRPFEDGTTLHRRYPMPWPSIAVTCGGFPSGDREMWFVESASVAPGFALFPQGLRLKGNGDCRFIQLPVDKESIEKTITRVMLSLCTARNASWVESSADRATRRRHPRIASVRFRHIEIDMGKPKSRHKTAEKYKQSDTPWHHRRGHWAYYDETRPLFGHRGPKNIGWVWRPYTEVGDKQYGEIVQDYSVAANLPQ